MSINNGWLLFLRALALFCFRMLSSQSVNAQVIFGSMVGNVSDASGGAIAGASVKITLTQTNESRTAVTNDSGAYTISTVTQGARRQRRRRSHLSPTTKHQMIEGLQLEEPDC